MVGCLSSRQISSAGGFRRLFCSLRSLKFNFESLTLALGKNVFVQVISRHRHFTDVHTVH